MYQFRKITPTATTVLAVPPIEAICQIDYPKDYGYIIFTEHLKGAVLKLHLKNLPPGIHGMHIHASADRRDGCGSTCAHYNPYKGTHKDVNQTGNHLGDLGNIEVRSDGSCEAIITVDNLPLVGPIQIMGRCVVIHEKDDDLGLGIGSDQAESIKTGNSGARIACGIIGYYEKMDTQKKV